MNDYYSTTLTMAPRRRRLDCEIDGCRKTPMYGYVEKRPTHCVDHKEAGMYNVIGRHCQNEDTICFTSASFGFPGSKPLYCKSHKKDGMVNVVTRRCVCCKKMASYGDVRVHPTHCKDHKEDHMVSNKTSSFQEEKVEAEVFTITSNSCAFCHTKAYWGNCMTGRKFCKVHMNPDTDWRVSFCKFPKCKQVSTHMKQDTLELLCAKHAAQCPSGSTYQYAPPLHQQQHVPTACLAPPLEQLPSLFPELASYK